MNPKKILVPIDYSAYSRQALEWGVDLATKYAAQVVVLHVIPKAVEELYPHGTAWDSIPSYYQEGLAPGARPSRGEPIIVDLVDKAQSELHDFAHRDLRGGVQVEAKIAVGSPAEEILRVAREEEVDLIVMGTHGRTGLRHALLGSVAEAMVRRGPCPVFTVRAGVEVAP